MITLMIERNVAPSWKKVAFIAKRLDIILQENALYDSNFNSSMRIANPGQAGNQN